MDPKLPTDVDANILFDDVIKKLVDDFEYDEAVAAARAREYYMKFADAEFCRKIGIPVQDDEFFCHEAAGGIALRIHYYLTLKGDPNPRSFINWRASWRQ